MTTRSSAVLALPMPRDAQGDEPHAQLRFAAIVRALAALAAPRPPAAPAPSEELPDVPTRRVNRLRRMLGRIRRRPLQGGKSRQHAR